MIPENRPDIIAWPVADPRGAKGEKANRGIRAIYFSLNYRELHQGWGFAGSGSTLVAVGFYRWLIIKLHPTDHQQLPAPPSSLHHPVLPRKALEQLRHTAKPPLPFAPTTHLHRLRVYSHHRIPDYPNIRQTLLMIGPHGGHISDHNI